MKLSGLRDYLEAELTYPIEQSSVVEQVGSVEIEAPDDPDTETISTIVDDVGQETYNSADELYTTVIGNVSDEYIGRKFYDDRGGNPAQTPSEFEDEPDVSF